MDPKDFIRIELTESITLNDIHALTKLFQPLIGAQAYALYMALVSDLNFQFGVKNTTVSQMLTKLEMGIPDFFQARLKLEGIGLLHIYTAKEEKGDYYYEVVAPLTAEDFFKDSLLRTMLIEKIGARLFKEEMSNLLAERTNKEGYKETTRSFLDVYHFDFQNTEVLTQTDFMPFDTSKQPKVAKTIEKTDTFDYNFFKSGLDKHFVSKESLTPTIKELIYTFHIVYGIDEMTMQRLILESADVDSGKVDQRKFTKNVEDNYLNKQKAKTPAKIQAAPALDEEQNDLQEKGFSANEIMIIEHAKRVAPIDYLASIKQQRGGTVIRTEQALIKNLVENTSLNKETINILIHYVMVAKESDNLKENFVMTIANNWAMNGISSAADAVAQINNMYTKPKKEAKPKQSFSKKPYKNPYNKARREEKLPDWAKADQPKSTEAAQTADQPASSEDSGSLQERLDRLKRLRQQKEDN